MTSLGSAAADAAGALGVNDHHVGQDKRRASSARRASLPMTKTNLSKGRLVHLHSARLVYEADQKIKKGDWSSCGPDPLSVRQALREL